MIKQNKNLSSCPPVILSSKICKILVTGAKGMLGQDLCPILEDEGYEVFEADLPEFDITKVDVVKQTFEEIKPDFVIHLAAYTNVDKAEEDIEVANLINVKGTENLAKICGEKDISILYISTDYVFDGEKGSPYKTTDKPNSLNNYGKTKLAGEEIIQKLCKKHYIVRTAWLYGIHGKNFVETMISLADKPELKVVDDQIGCPTWTCDLSNGIVGLIEEKAEYGIYHICGGGSTSWYGFAKEIGVDAKPCKTEEFPRPAKRPKYSVMDNCGICRDWKLGLKDYMKLRIEE